MPNPTIVMYEANALRKLLKDSAVSESRIDEIVRAGNPRHDYEATFRASRKNEPKINIATTGNHIYIINRGDNDDTPDFFIEMQGINAGDGRSVDGKVPPRNPD